jgi:hypothetical protein
MVVRGLGFSGISFSQNIIGEMFISSIPPAIYHIRPYSGQILAEDTQMNSPGNEVHEKHQEVSS